MQSCTKRPPSGLIFVFLLVLFVFMAIGKSSAQTESHIKAGTTVTWSSNQSLNYSVVVDSGAVLRINSGISVKFYYADMTNDNEGDFKIEVAKYGRLIINGTPGAGLVTFGPLESSPKPVHWQGIILDANDAGASPDTLKFFTVSYAKKGLVINRPVELHAPTFDKVSTGIEVNSFTSSSELILPACTFTNVTGTAMAVKQANTKILYPTITTVTGGGNGIELYENNAVIDWATIDQVSGSAIAVKAKGANVTISNAAITRSGKSGIFNDQATAQITITNSSVTTSGKSGLFNVDGTVTANNSTFSSNAFSGIVNSSGTLTINNSDVSLNTLDGITACGLSTTTAKSVNITNNTKYGVNIVDNKMTADVSPIAGTAELAPTVSVTYSNITGNNAALADVNNSSASTSITENFTYNFWGVDNNIGALVTFTKPNSINYIYWVTSGVNYSITGADLTTPLSLTVDDKSTKGGLNYIQAEPFTLNWETTGKFPLVKVKKIENGVTITDYFANTYKYTVVPTGLAATFTIDVSKDDGSNSAPQVTVNRQASLTLTFPLDGGSALVGGKDTVITWVAPSNVTALKLEYKISGTYTEIAASVPNTGSYHWTVPNLDVKVGGAGTGCFVKITEVAGGVASDEASTGSSIYPTPEAAWNYKSTGASENFNITTIAEDLTGPDQQSRVFTTGEVIYVGAFYTDGSDTKCAGYVKTSVTNVAAGVATLNTTGAAITVFGDDISTPEKEGFADQEPITFKVWRADQPNVGKPWGDDMGTGNSRDVAAAGSPKFTDRNMIAAQTLAYTVTPGGTVTPTSGPGAQEISIASGLSSKWFLISSYIDPTVKTLAWVAADPADGSGAILDPIAAPEKQGFKTAADATKFNMLKDIDGKVYWVNGGSVLISDFTTWDKNKGYFLNMASGATGVLKLDGNVITPETNPLSLSAGWNLIPYHRYSNMAPAVALNTIASGLTLVKDIDGNIYWPAYGINTLGNMMPGKAYLVKLSSAQTLTYPKNTGAIPLFPKESAANEAAENTVHFKTGFNSDNSSVVAFLEESLKGKANEGDEIGAFNSEGKLCGSSVYKGGNAAVVIWGVESGKEEGSGMKNDEAYSFRIWNKNNGSESILNGISYTEGLGKYSVNGISVIGGISNAESAIPQEFSLSQNYPNPFNPSTTISFGLPKDSKVRIVIYNMLGQAVKELASGFFSAGYHNVKFNAESLASGVYIYQIKADNFSASKKLNLLK
ncbi:MAG: T9SS type A sorting domain-containing protein [Bacillota bacterium]